MSAQPDASPFKSAEPCGVEGFDGPDALGGWHGLLDLAASSGCELGAVLGLVPPALRVVDRSAPRQDRLRLYVDSARAVAAPAAVRA